MYSILCILLIVFSCEQKPDNSAQETFEKNSQIILNELENWVNETPDYSNYASDFVAVETAFGAEKDSLTLNEVIENDKMTMQMFDFKMLNEPVLLPGVNADTKMADGSVRHYSDWEVTLPATDSTEAKSGVIKTYQSFDFDEEGKIRYSQMYADFGGLMQHLMSSEPMHAEGDME
ncbi:hypothetical protein [Changchengzhania lutea]|uniref:hypothetical protein n=1 Tax=Changchengzhania lutea TaxID=2049305 RepID=UPI00115E2D1F|nr:hypothetical protein [Changchengzhania lutea]